MAPRKSSAEALPLLWVTPPVWAEQVLCAPLALLNDHAWLEKKAAANALELLNRWPEPNPPENWVSAMTAVARDEVEHLAMVVRLLARRGGRLTKLHSNPYAADLRKIVRSGHGPEELVDRLLVSALIEARSCERFLLLSRASADGELAKVYQGLFASEAGHYRLFLDLAQQLPNVRAVDTRWHQLLIKEAEIIQCQPPGFAMHSGLQVAFGPRRSRASVESAVHSKSP